MKYERFLLKKAEAYAQKANTFLDDFEYELTRERVTSLFSESYLVFYDNINKQFYINYIAIKHVCRQIEIQNFDYTDYIDYIESTQPDFKFILDFDFEITKFDKTDLNDIKAEETVLFEEFVNNETEFVQYVVNSTKDDTIQNITGLKKEPFFVAKELNIDIVKKNLSKCKTIVKRYYKYKKADLTKAQILNILFEQKQKGIRIVSNDRYKIISEMIHYSLILKTNANWLRDTELMQKEVINKVINKLYEIKDKNLPLSYYKKVIESVLTDSHHAVLQGRATMNFIKICFEIQYETKEKLKFKIIDKKDIANDLNTILNNVFETVFKAA